jgi:hypothetical protein
VLHISQWLKLEGGKVLSSSEMQTFYKRGRDRVGYWNFTTVSHK